MFSTLNFGCASYATKYKLQRLYLRNMYTFIKRTVPPASMGIFDASNRDQCEVKRQNTNTPLQALAMMNDPMVLEAARVLAAKLLQEKGTEQEKINKAFRLIVCRKPIEKESQLLTELYNWRLQNLNPKTATKLLAVGEYPISKNTNKNKLVALMQVIVNIYNLEETITKT